MSEVPAGQDDPSLDQTDWSGFYDDPEHDEILLSPELRQYAATADIELIDVSPLPATELETALSSPSTPLFSQRRHRKNFILGRLKESEGEAGEEAKWKLVDSNLPVVIYTITKNMKLEGSVARESIGSGIEGLIRAAQKHDPDYKKEGRKVRFISYAQYWIRARVIRETDEEGHVIRIGSPEWELLRRADKEEEILIENGSEPTLAQVAEATDIKSQQLSDLRYWSNIATLDPEVDVTERTEISVEEQVMEICEVDLLRQALEYLTYKERDIIIRHNGLFGRPKQTQKEIGKEYRQSKSNISLIEIKALRKLAGVMIALKDGEEPSPYEEEETALKD